MGVDLHRIGFGISSGFSRNGFGTIVSFPSGPSYPPYGTFISGGTGSNVFYADGAGGTFNIETINYYSYGTYLRQDETTIYVSPCGSQISVGSSTTNYFSDGYGSYYTGMTGGYSPYGTYLTNCNNQDHYSDGSGGYYSTSSYPSYGTYLSTQNFTNNLSWSAPDGNSGSWTYSYGSYDVYADGYGGTYTSNSMGYTQPYGTQITSGSYSTSWTDEYGNTYYNYYNYTIYFDGSSGYYTNTY